MWLQIIGAALVAAVLTMALLASLAKRRNAAIKDKIADAEYEVDAKAGKHGLGPFMARNGYPPTNPEPASNDRFDGYKPVFSDESEPE